VGYRATGTLHVLPDSRGDINGMHVLAFRSIQARVI
jgi:hypothetical protein